MGSHPGDMWVLALKKDLIQLVFKGTFVKKKKSLFSFLWILGREGWVNLTHQQYLGGVSSFPLALFFLSSTLISSPTALCLTGPNLMCPRGILRQVDSFKSIQCCCVCVHVLHLHKWYYYLLFNLILCFNALTLYLVHLWLFASNGCKACLHHTLLSCPLVMDI